MIPKGFQIKNCIPQREDFEKVLDAKKTGNYSCISIWWNDVKPYCYKALRLFITSILLQYSKMTDYSFDSSQKYTDYDKNDLKSILADIVKSPWIEKYKALYKEFKAINVEDPAVATKKIQDARKGEIQVKVKSNPEYYRIIPYSLKYTGNDDPTVAKTGIRMHLFFGKKEGNVYKIVIRGANLYGSGKENIDEPLFATEQEARDFIANLDKIESKVDTKNWRFVISDKKLVKTQYKEIGRRIINGVDYGPEYGPDYLNDLKDAVKVDTICGPAWILKSSSYCVESLEEKCMNEAVEKHDILNPKIFDGNKVKPEVREKVQEVVNEYIKLLLEENIFLKVQDVILAGSNASYNYTENSDLDVHILANVNDVDDPNDLYPKIYNAYRRIFESKFDITFYGIPVEIYVELTKDTNLISNGVYSIMFDEWIKEPKESYVPNIDEDAIKKAAEPWIVEAENIIKDVDDNVADGDEEIDDYINRIYEMRQRGLHDTNGSEFSTENLIFKEVRNAGLLDKLKNLKNVIVSKKLSLEEDVKYLDDAKEFKDYGTAEVEGGNVIDTTRASTFATQDLLDHSEDAAYDGIVYDIVDLTPIQYFELCGKVQDIAPETLMDYIKTDERQLAHIKDVILKYHKRLQMPYVSFSKMDEVSGQEGRHRMYALGEMFGWDKEFPVMVVQDLGAKKTIGELLHESITEDFYLPEKDRRDYIVKITQLAHNQPIIQQNGLFHIYNVKESDYNTIIAALRKQPWIEYVSATAERYDFSKLSYQGIPSRYYSITGKIKIEESLDEYLNDEQRYEVRQDLTKAAEGNIPFVSPNDNFAIHNISTNRAEPINKKIHQLDYIDDALVDGTPGWTAKKEKFPNRPHIITGKIDPHKVD